MLVLWCWCWCWCWSGLVLVLWCCGAGAGVGATGCPCTPEGEWRFELGCRGLLWSGTAVVAAIHLLRMCCIRHSRPLTVLVWKKQRSDVINPHAHVSVHTGDCTHDCASRGYGWRRLLSPEDSSIRTPSESSRARSIGVAMVEVGTGPQKRGMACFVLTSVG